MKSVSFYVTLMLVELPVAGSLREDVPRDTVGLPHKAFRSLNISEYDYVRIYGKRGSRILRAKKLPAKSQQIVRLRAGTRHEIGVDMEDMVKVERIEETSCVNVRVHFGRKEDVGQGKCRLHPKILKMLGTAEGGLIELFNPDTGGRILLHAEEHDLKYENAILIDKQIRRLLNVDEKTVGTEEAQQLKVRKNIFMAKKESILDRLLKFIVGYKWLMLRVVMGIDVDEGKNIVRLRKDNINVLGLEENDVVDIYWRNKKVECRVLQIPPLKSVGAPNLSASNYGFAISICASERRKLDVDLFDIVRIRRSPQYVFKKHFDRAILTSITALGLYVMLMYQLGASQGVAITTTAMVWVILLLSLFAKVRGEV